MKFRLTTIFALTLSFSASSAFAFNFNFGTKGEITKGVEKALAKKPVCVNWISQHKEATVVMEDGKAGWRDKQKLLEKLEAAGFVTLGLNSLNLVTAKKIPLTSSEDLMGLKIRMGLGENIMVRQATLTDAGKAAHTKVGYKYEGLRYSGLCSLIAKYDLNEVIRWTEPTPSEGKTVTEAIFSFKVKNLDGPFVKFFGNYNLEEKEGVVKLYKTSEGWIPLGKIGFRSTEK